MTTTPTLASTPTVIRTAPAAPVREVAEPIMRTAATTLLLGGPASLALHVLWRIGHGPTVVNEHGVVLGLTNDEWSRLGPMWAVPVALAVAVVMALHPGRLARATTWLTATGLVVGAAAAWIWPLYSVGALALGGGLACLSVTLWRGRVAPRWLAAPPALAVVALVPMALLPGAVHAVEVTVASVDADLTDLPVVAAAVTWTALGLAFLRRR